MKIHKVIEGKGDQVIFYVHGFMPTLVHEIKKKNSNLKNLFNADFDGSVYFIDWNSSGVTMISRLLKALTIITFLPIPPFRIFRYPTLVGDFISKFKQADLNAEKCGLELYDEIKKHLPRSSQKKIHLIGHSLGSKVIHESLLTGKWSELNLWNVVYLGSAVKKNENQRVHNKEFGRVLSQIKGNLFNFYSKRDLVLKVLPTKRIGLGKIIGVSKKQIKGGEKIVDVDAKLFHIQYTKPKHFRNCMETIYDKGEINLFF